MAVVVLELGGGLWVAAGVRGAGALAVILAGYTLVVNVVFHAFWSVPSDMVVTELSLFFKNVAVAGGLVAVAGALATRRGG